MLKEHQKTLWDRYCRAEEDRIRSVYLSALDQFVSTLSLKDIEIWKSFAYEIALKHVDLKDPFPIRFPLFTNVLFPALVYGLNHKEPHCARWLSGFTQFIYHRKECQEALSDIGWSHQQLLRVALTQHPSDILARNQLIDSIASYLEYTLHELPAGVLYDQNSANEEQCEELKETLGEFVELTKRSDASERYSTLIEKCRYHYHRYPLYLTEPNKYGSYENYLRVTLQGG